MALNYFFINKSQFWMEHYFGFIFSLSFHWCIVLSTKDTCDAALESSQQKVFRGTPLRWKHKMMAFVCTYEDIWRNDRKLTNAGCSLRFMSLQPLATTFENHLFYIKVYNMLKCMFVGQVLELNLVQNMLTSPVPL